MILLPQPFKGWDYSYAPPTILLLHTFAPPMNIDHLTNIAACHTYKPVKPLQVPERVSSHFCLKDGEVDRLYPSCCPQAESGRMCMEGVGGWGWGWGLFSSTLPLPGENWSGKGVARMVPGSLEELSPITSSPGSRSHHISAVYSRFHSHTSGPWPLQETVASF